MPNDNHNFHFIIWKHYELQIIVIFHFFIYFIFKFWQVNWSKFIKERLGFNPNIMGTTDIWLKLLNNKVVDVRCPPLDHTIRPATRPMRAGCRPPRPRTCLDGGVPLLNQHLAPSHIRGWPHLAARRADCPTGRLATRWPEWVIGPLSQKPVFRAHNDFNSPEMAFSPYLAK